MTGIDTGPAVEAAIRWWQGALRGRPTHDNGDVTYELLASWATEKLSAPPTEEQIGRFGDELRRLFREGRRYRAGAYPALGLPEREETMYILNRNGEGTLGVDYGPDAFLDDPAQAAGIHHLRFPTKTVMWIYPDRVTVKRGYGAPVETVWRRENG